MTEQAVTTQQPTTLQRYQIDGATTDLIKTVVLDGQKAIKDAAEGDFTATMLMGAAICDLQGLILQNKNITNMLMSLQGKSLGFRTDKDNAGGYDPNTVVACYTEAALKGLPPVGNCWNIISSRVYTTKEGFAYLLNRAGVNYSLIPGLPENEKTLPNAMPGKSALRTVEVPITVKWDKNKSEKLRFEIRVNNGMTADAVIGKAKAKALKWLYEQVQTNQFLQMESADNAEPLVINTPAAARTIAAPTTKQRNVVEMWLDGELKKNNINGDPAAILEFAKRKGYDINDTEILAENMLSILHDMETERQAVTVEA